MHTKLSNFFLKTDILKNCVSVPKIKFVHFGAQWFLSLMLIVESATANQFFFAWNIPVSIFYIIFWKFFMGLKKKRVFMGYDKMVYVIFFTYYKKWCLSWFFLLFTVFYIIFCHFYFWLKVAREWSLKYSTPLLLQRTSAWFITDGAETETTI